MGHQALVRVCDRFTQDVERFVRQRPFQLGKNDVFFQIDVTREMFAQRREVGTELRIGRGGVAQGVGFALYEKVVWQAGRMQNAQMTNYIMPTSLDVPDIFVEFDDRATKMGTATPNGPKGAKGIGELPLDGSAPAVISAVQHATATAVAAVPMTPEDLMQAVETAR